MQVAMGSWTMQIMIFGWVNMVYLVSCIIEYRNIVPYIKSRIIPYHPRQVALGAWTTQIIFCEWATMDPISYTIQ